MKRIIKSVLGVTLLEVMLVLAIAAMVIVMSIRYYQSSTSSQETNAAMEDIQAIASAMDNISNGGAGSYTSITASTLAAVVGSSNMMSPTNQSIVLGTTTATTYSVTIPLNDTICTSVSAKLAAIPQINSAATAPACSNGTLTYMYDTTVTQ